MYFVDIEKIGELLLSMEELLDEVQLDTLDVGAIRDRLALERYAGVIIETILDVGHLLIDGFIMRDAGSYEDIIDILDDEGVLSKQMSSDYLELIRYRKKIVRDYYQVDFAELKELIQRHQRALKIFPNEIRQYLQKDKEVAHIFNTFN